MKMINADVKQIIVTAFKKKRFNIKKRESLKELTFQKLVDLLPQRQTSSFTYPRTDLTEIHTPNQLKLLLLT